MEKEGHCRLCFWGRSASFHSCHELLPAHIVNDMETMTVPHNGAHRDVLSVTQTYHRATLTLIRAGMSTVTHTHNRSSRNTDWVPGDIQTRRAEDRYTKKSIKPCLPSVTDSLHLHIVTYGHIHKGKYLGLSYHIQHIHTQNIKSPTHQ